MTRSLENALVLAFGLAAVACATMAWLAGHTGFESAGALLALAAYAALVAAVAWTRARLRRLADEERRDAALARTERPDAALFGGEDNEAEPFSIGRTAEQVERFAVPAIPLLLAVGLGFAARSAARVPVLAEPPENGLLAAAVCAALAFAAFLPSRYLIGLARRPDVRLGRAPGIALGLVSLGAVLCGAAGVAAHLGLPAADRIAQWILVAALAALAIENLAAFVVTLYLPRRPHELRVPYESRLAALLTDPAPVARTLAESFDYQFGLPISESASMRFLRSALLPLLLFQLLALYAMSSIVVLAPHEEAVLERFGQPIPDRWHLTSGAHLKAPWPFETVRRVPARRVLHTTVGYRIEEGREHPDTILWTVPHYAEEDTFLTAGASGDGEGEAISVGMVSFNIRIEFQPTNLLDYVYTHATPVDLLRDLGYRALTRELATRSLADLVGGARREIGERVRAEVQRRAEDLGLGVEILFAGAQSVHPPVPVAAAFQSVVGALEEREASILDARGYANGLLPVAEAAAEQRRVEAAAQAERRRISAAAEAGLFESRLAAYRTTPRVFASDLYLSALAESLAGARKYIVDSPGAREVLTFNFEEKPVPDLFELSPLPEEEHGP